MRNAKDFFEDNIRRIAPHQNQIADQIAYNSNMGMIALAEQVDSIQRLLRQIEARLATLEQSQGR